MSENLRIYNGGAVVPNEAQRPITSGRLTGKTDINPMWRIKKLTELFGPCGVGWWYEITDKTIRVDDITKQAAAFVDIKLYYVDPESGETSHGIMGTGGASFVAQERGGPHLSDECFKMALTDAISVAAKALGIGASIYFSADRSKYTNDTETPSQTAQQPQDTPKTVGPGFVCESCGKQIFAYKDANGGTVGVRKHCEGSKNKFGKVLCLDCIQSGEGLKE